MPRLIATLSSALRAPDGPSPARRQTPGEGKYYNDTHFYVRGVLYGYIRYTHKVSIRYDTQWYHYRQIYFICKRIRIDSSDIFYFCSIL